MRVLTILCALGLVLEMWQVLAWGGAAAPDPVEVRLELGSDDPKMQHFFIPSRLRLKLGRRYRLLIHNPSKVTHYFSSGDLHRRVISRKLYLLDDGGRRIRMPVARIHKFELPPGATAEWTILPYKLGKNLKVYCALPEHKKAGLIADVDVLLQMAEN